MTPAITHCTQMCLFCWRFQNFTEKELHDFDDPGYILEHAIEAQKKLITGFKGDPRCDQKKWKEANEPNMLACSLSGEPTLYPKLGEFFEACHRKGITTFLVTNGTTPAALEQLEIPYQNNSMSRLSHQLRNSIRKSVLRSFQMDGKRSSKHSRSSLLLIHEP